MDKQRDHNFIEQVNDQGFQINFLNREYENESKGMVQNPQTNSFLNLNLFQNKKVGAEEEVRINSANIESGNQNYLENNFNGAPQNIGQQYFNSSNFIYQQNVINSNQASNSELNFIHQQIPQSNQQNLLSQGVNNGEGMQYEMNEINSLYTKLEDFNKNGFTSISSGQVQIPENENFKMKRDLKNTYIKKISSLINSNSDQQQQEYLQIPPNTQQIHSENQSSSSEIEGIERIHRRLARSRESARSSRRRKRIYLELLENKVTSQYEELEKSKLALEANNQYLNKLNLQTQHLNEYLFAREQLYEKIEKQLQSNVEETQVNLLLEQMKLILGSTGKERIAAVNYFFDQILDICIPAHYRYLLWTAQDSLDMFNEGNFLPEKRAPWRQEILNSLQLSEDQQKMMQALKQRFQTEKQKLADLIDNLQETKKEIQERQFQVEKIFDDIKNVFNPYQNVAFLSLLDKSKFQREISSNNLWEAIKKENMEYEFGEIQQALLNTHISNQTDLNHNDMREQNSNLSEFQNEFMSQDQNIIPEVNSNNMNPNCNNNSNNYYQHY